MTNPIFQPEKLAELMRSKRDALGYSQRDLAAASGVSNSYIQAIEAARGDRPRATTLRAICRGLHLTEDDERHALTLAAYDPDQHMTAPPIGRPTVSARELTATIRKLTPEQRGAAEILLRGLADRTDGAVA